MQKFSSFGRKKKNRPKFDIEWLCSKVFNLTRVICANGIRNKLMKHCIHKEKERIPDEMAVCIKHGGIEFRTTENKSSLWQRGGLEPGTS